LLQFISINDNSAGRYSRLVAALLQLWTFIDFFHPDTEQNVNWKAALIEAFPKLSAAMSGEHYAAVVNEMLAHLDDPSTLLWTESAQQGLSGLFKEARPVSEHLGNGRWLLKINNGKTFNGNVKEAVIALNAIAEQITSCSEIIIDLRSNSFDADGELIGKAFEASILSRVLSDRPLAGPSQSYRYYHGLPPAQGTTTGGYQKFRKLLEAKAFTPHKHPTFKRVVFIVNRFSYLPAVAVALQFASGAQIIGDGPVHGGVANRCETVVIPGLGSIDVRLSEFGSNKAFYGGFRVNETIAPQNGKDIAIERAIAMFEDNAYFNKGMPFYPVSKVGNFKRTTARKAFPDKLERALAAVRIWFIFRFFFPYRDLMDEDWDRILLDYLPVFEQCANPLEYAKAIARMTAHVHDSHVWVKNDELTRFLRPPVEPFTCRLIEGKVVVVSLTEAAAEGGLNIGDVIERIDGEDVFARMHKFRTYISASTAQYESWTLLGMIFRGAENSLIALDINNGKTKKNISFKRRSGQIVSRAAGVGCEDAVRILDGNIGYVDLTQLHVDAVEAMFEKLSQTIGIVFDMRGYPHGTAWPISARLVQRNRATPVKVGKVTLTDIPAAVFKCPLNPFAEDQSFPGWRAFVQNVPWSSDWKYEGKTVMLIDERAISQSEHTGLLLKAANDTTFVGTPTAGANGDVTNFSVPGGVNVYLTGQAVEHPDGRQLQRLGLTPDILISPTIDGIRAGKDEVLEKAVAFISGC